MLDRQYNKPNPTEAFRDGDWNCSYSRPNENSNFTFTREIGGCRCFISSRELVHRERDCVDVIVQLPGGSVYRETKLFRSPKKGLEALGEAMDYISRVRDEIDSSVLAYLGDRLTKN